MSSADGEQRQQQDPYNNGELPVTRAVRFPAWVGLASFSIIALIAILTRKHENDGAQKFALTVIIFSTIFGWMGVFGYLGSRAVFMGTIPELVLVRKPK